MTDAVQHSLKLLGLDSEPKHFYGMGMSNDYLDHEALTMLIEADGYGGVYPSDIEAHVGCTAQRAAGSLKRLANKRLAVKALADENGEPYPFMDPDYQPAKGQAYRLDGRRSMTRPTERVAA